MAFGKLDAVRGLSLKKHPYNLLNLSFHLHNGYDVSDKNSSLNLKFETFQKLYK
ncbi:7909_t:CDS:1, partial [Dentiscutata erythropus]